MRAALAAPAPSAISAMIQTTKQKDFVRSTHITFRIGAAGEAAVRATLNPASV
ncbi:hypothetical protein GCM10007937_33780 [Mesorhizobium albiziae]|nr:hypothetical protein GCM10007937_33780 [Mesorhizobium albiziae]